MSPRLAAGALAAGLGLRVAAAIVRPAWHDEYFTAWAATLPLADLVAALRLDSGPPLPYLAVKLLTAAGLPPIAAARVLALAAGVAALLLAGRAAARAFGSAAGWWTAVLLALHPLAIAWSCEGRAYALVLLAAAWAWERLESLAATGRGTAGLALAVSLGVWSHGLGLVLAATVAVAALLTPATARRKVLLAAAVGLASHLPWLPVAAAQPPAALLWMRDAWQWLPPAARVLAPVRLLPSVAAYGNTLDLPTPPLVVVLLAAASMLLLVAGGRSGPPTARAALLLGLPALGLAALAHLGVPAFFPGRTEAVFLTPALALAAAGCRGRRRVAGLLLACGGAVMATLAVAGWITAPPPPEARLTAAIRSAMPAGGQVVTTGYWGLGLRSHLASTGGAYTVVWFPAEAGTHPGWFDPGQRPAPQELGRLSARLMTPGSGAAVVVAAGLPGASELLRTAAAAGLQPIWRAPGVLLLVRP